MYGVYAIDNKGLILFPKLIFYGSHIVYFSQCMYSPEYLTTLSIDSQRMEAAGESSAALGWWQLNNQANRRLRRPAQMQPGVQDRLRGVEARRQQLQPGGLIPGHRQSVVHQQRGVAVCVIPAKVQSATKISSIPLALLLSIFISPFPFAISFPFSIFHFHFLFFPISLFFIVIFFCWTGVHQIFNMPHLLFGASDTPPPHRIPRLLGGLLRTKNSQHADACKYL